MKSNNILAIHPTTKVVGFLAIYFVKKGDVFFECEGGGNYKLAALTNARKLNDGWYCVVEDNQGVKHELFVSNLTKHRGPNLFWEPRYTTKIEREVVYIID